MPLAAAAGDRPGRQRDEQRDELGQRVRQQPGKQQRGGEVELPGQRRRALAEDEGLVMSEKAVAPMTKAIASGPAVSCTQRRTPVYRRASSGIELPAMKPATQASACSASTRPLRNRTWATSASAGSMRSPGNARPPGSGSELTATTQTAASSRPVTVSAPASQPRSTSHGRPFQAWSVVRVSASPRTSARSEAATAPASARRGGRRDQPLSRWPDMRASRPKRSLGTSSAASLAMRHVIFDCPRSRSRKMIGTSTTRKPARTARCVSSTWKA